MPLRVIKDVLDDDPERAAALVELEDRILERAISAQESGRVSRAAVKRRYEIPENVLARMEELGVLSPTSRGYDADDVGIIEAISRFRAGGYDESLGFTVYDALRYREHLQPLVEEEVHLLDRLAPATSRWRRAAEIIASGAEPMRELIGAVHSSCCSPSCGACAPASAARRRVLGAVLGPGRRGAVDGERTRVDGAAVERLLARDPSERTDTVPSSPRFVHTASALERDLHHHDVV
jgi:hypothetical protein